MGCTGLEFFRELGRVRKRDKGGRRRHSIGLNPVFALGGVKDLQYNQISGEEKKLLECHLGMVPFAWSGMLGPERKGERSAGDEKGKM